MQTITTVSLATFSTASKYPVASTASRWPYFLLLGLTRRCCFDFSSCMRAMRQLRMNSASSSPEPSGEDVLSRLLLLLMYEDEEVDDGWVSTFGLDEEKEMGEKACRVRRKDCLRALSKERASAMTPLGPVLASKTLVGSVYVLVELMAGLKMLGLESSVSEMAVWPDSKSEGRESSKSERLSSEWE